MAIISLRIADFRNLSSVALTPCDHGLNIFFGQNGSGKTSLLESIHCVGLGRSFRSGVLGQLVRHTTEKFVLFAQLLDHTGRQIPVGIERELGGSMRLRVNEADDTSLAELATLLPLRVINAQAHNLFEAGPLFRRKFLDWGLFYQFEHFLPCWRHFERTLKQRNAILREKRPKRELDVWTGELVKHGLALDALRRDYVQRLVPFIAAAAQDLLALPELQISYHPGWDEGWDYAAILQEAYPDDYRCGHTQAGPHRADLDIKIEGLAVKNFLSRGQQKLLVCAMMLAQGMMLARQANKRVVYLIDDLPSELDKQSRQRLISLLVKQQAQVFITAIDSGEICDHIERQSAVPVKVFHVEHGRVTMMSEILQE